MSYRKDNLVTTEKSNTQNHKCNIYTAIPLQLKGFVAQEFPNPGTNITGAYF